jgi:hypothetical protein
MNTTPLTFEVRSAKEALEAALELIKDERNWCQGCLARNITGSDVPPQSPDAMRFCAVGALCRVAVGALCRVASHYNDAILLLIKARENMRTGFMTLAQFNDRFGHQTVLELYRNAIKLAEEEANSIRKESV